MSYELKPCPFCGGRADLQRNGAVKVPYWEVVCYNCDITCHAHVHADAAASAWNSRHEADRRARSALAGDGETGGLEQRLRDGAWAIDNDGTPSQVGPSADELREAATLISQLRNRLSDLEGWSEDMTKAPMKPGVKIDVLLQIGERITLGWWFQQKPGSVGWWTDGHWPVKPDKWMAIPSPSPSPPIPAVDMDGKVTVKLWKSPTSEKGPPVT